MSDKIKSEYTKYADEIKPSEEFTAQLTKKLEDESAKKKCPKIRRFKQIAAVAACLVIAVAAALALHRGFGAKPLPNGGTSYADPSSFGMGDYIGEINTEPLNIATFDPISWYDESMSASGLPLALAAKLGSSLDYLAYNDENKFVDAERADAETIARIRGFLEEAAETGDCVSGEKVYYMAVFSDGTVAKFSIAGGQFLEIPGDQKIYKKTDG